jgi:hypothetical protein
MLRTPSRSLMNPPCNRLQALTHLALEFRAHGIRNY